MQTFRGLDFLKRRIQMRPQASDFRGLDSRWTTLEVGSLRWTEPCGAKAARRSSFKRTSGHGSKSRSPIQPLKSRLKWVVNSPTPKWDTIDFDSDPQPSECMQTCGDLDCNMDQPSALGASCASWLSSSAMRVWLWRLGFRRPCKCVTRGTRKWRGIPLLVPPYIFATQEMVPSNKLNSNCFECPGVLFSDLSGEAAKEGTRLPLNNWVSGMHEPPRS